MHHATPSIINARGRDWTHRLPNKQSKLDLGPTSGSLINLCSGNCPDGRRDTCRCGLIFIQSEDPLSRLVRAVTKQDFTTMGFYCYTTCASSPRELVILIDLFENTSPCFSTPDVTLDDLRLNPLVSRIAIKRLKDAKYSVAFKKAIAEVATCARPTVLDLVHSLFGDDREAATRPMPVDVVNRVISRMNAAAKIKPEATVSAEAINSLRLPEQLGTDIEAKYQLLDLVTFPFTSRPDAPSLASYLVENELFGSLEEVAMPFHHESVLKQAKEAALNRYRSTLDRVVSATVDEIMKDPDFFAKVIDGVNFGRQMQASSRGLGREAVQSLSNKTQALLKRLEGKTPITPTQLNQIKADMMSDLQMLNLMWTDKSGRASKSSKGSPRIRMNGVSPALNSTVDQQLDEVYAHINGLWSDTAVKWRTDPTLDVANLNTHINEIQRLFQKIEDNSGLIIKPAPIPVDNYVQSFTINANECHPVVTPLKADDDHKSWLASAATLLALYVDNLSTAATTGVINKCEIADFQTFAQTWSKNMRRSDPGIAQTGSFPKQIKVTNTTSMTNGRNGLSSLNAFKASSPGEAMYHNAAALWHSTLAPFLNQKDWSLHLPAHAVASQRYHQAASQVMQDKNKQIPNQPVQTVKMIQVSKPTNCRVSPLPSANLSEGEKVKAFGDLTDQFLQDLNTAMENGHLDGCTIVNFQNTLKQWGQSLGYQDFMGDAHFTPSDFEPTPPAATKVISLKGMTPTLPTNLRGVTKSLSAKANGTSRTNGTNGSNNNSASALFRQASDLWNGTIWSTIFSKTPWTMNVPGYLGKFRAFKQALGGMQTSPPYHEPNNVAQQIDVTPPRLCKVIQPLDPKLSDQEKMRVIGDFGTQFIQDLSTAMENGQLDGCVILNAQGTLRQYAKDLGLPDLISPYVKTSDLTPIPPNTSKPIITQGTIPPQVGAPPTFDDLNLLTYSAADVWNSVVWSAITNPPTLIVDAYVYKIRALKEFVIDRIENEIGEQLTPAYKEPAHSAGEMELTQGSCPEVVPLNNDLSHTNTLKAFGSALLQFVNDVSTGIETGMMDECVLSNFYQRIVLWSDQVGQPVEKTMIRPDNLPDSLKLVGPVPRQSSSLPISNHLSDFTKQLVQDLRDGKATKLDINTLIKEVNRLTGSQIKLIEGETTLPASVIITGHQ